LETAFTYAAVVPLYMDRHDAPVVTREELVDLRMRDVEVQEPYRVSWQGDN